MAARPGPRERDVGDAEGEASHELLGQTQGTCNCPPGSRGTTLAPHKHLTCTRLTASCPGPSVAGFQQQRPLSGGLPWAYPLPGPSWPPRDMLLCSCDIRVVTCVTVCKSVRQAMIPLSPGEASCPRSTPVPSTAWGEAELGVSRAPLLPTHRSSDPKVPESPGSSQESLSFSKAADCEENLL